MVPKKAKKKKHKNIYISFNTPMDTESKSRLHVMLVVLSFIATTFLGFIIWRWNSIYSIQMEGSGERKGMYFHINKTIFTKTIL